MPWKSWSIFTKNFYFRFSWTPEFKSCLDHFSDVLYYILLCELQNILWEKYEKRALWGISSKSELMSVLCSQFSGLCIFEGRGWWCEKSSSKGCRSYIHSSENVSEQTCFFMFDSICLPVSYVSDVLVTDGPIYLSQR